MSAAIRFMVGQVLRAKPSAARVGAKAPRYDEEAAQRLFALVKGGLPVPGASARVGIPEGVASNIIEQRYGGVKKLRESK